MARTHVLRHSGRCPIAASIHAENTVRRCRCFKASCYTRLGTQKSQNVSATASKVNGRSAVIGRGIAKETHSMAAVARFGQELVVLKIEGSG
jgi:hypothetical protein